jgi:UDP-glucose 4-epimerase
MKRVILTGATGFIGANLAHRLLTEGHEVHLLLRKGYSRWRIDTIQNEVNIHIVDLIDAEALKSCIASIQPDWVFHLAVYGAYSTQSDLRLMNETNFIATANLVDVCSRIGFESFINTGSSSEYGIKNYAPSENDLIEPNSIYGITKAAATHYCRHMALSRKLSLTTLRLYSVFGPYEEPTRLIPTLIVEGLKGGLPPLVNPSISRDYTYINDVLDAYILTASNPTKITGKIYNLGTGVQTSLHEVVDLACLILPIKVEPEWGTMPDRQWDTSIWVADHSNITKDLGWLPKHTLKVGFERSVDWLISNESIINYYQSNRTLPK